jgi:hypothetical protein
MVAGNATGASDAAQKLLAEATAAAGMVTLNAEILAKKTSTSDAAAQKSYGDLSLKIESNLKAAAAEKDPLKRGILLNLDALRAEKAKLDSASGAPAAAPAAAPETPAPAGSAPSAQAPGETPTPAPAPAEPQAQTPPAEEPEPELSMANFGPWLKYQVNSLKKSLNDTVSFFKSLPSMIGGILGIFGIKSALGKPEAAAGAAPEDPKMQQVRKFLIDTYKLTEDEFGKLNGLKLKEFLDMASAPHWMDKTRFIKLKKDLISNKKDSDNTDIPLWEFLADKISGWKEAPAEGSGVTA